MFDWNGKLLQKSSFAEHGVTESLHCVAIDDTSDHVYAAGINRLIRLSPKLQLINTVTRHLSMYFAIAVVGDEVMACNFCGGGIDVYTKELSYVRVIDNKTSLGLSSDQLGNLYVTSVEKSCINIFSNTGTFLRSINGPVLNKPRDICIAGQYVYVDNEVSDGSHCVSIFTTEEGKHVTSFGKFVSCAICVDNDGFVYIISRKPNAINVF